MTRRFRQMAFSLVEIVVALGIFATGVVVVIALIGSSASHSRESMDSKIAYGMAEQIRSVVVSETGSALPVFNTGSPLHLVASRSGDDVRIDVNDGRDAYYLIEISAATSPEMVRDQARGTVGAEVAVFWPFRAPGAAAASSSSARNSVHYQLLFVR